MGGRGGAHPLHPPPRSAPESCYHLFYCVFLTMIMIMIMIVIMIMDNDDDNNNNNNNNNSNKAEERETHSQ